MSQHVYQVIAHFRAAEGRADVVAENLVALAAASREEPENLEYVVSRSLENPDHFVIVESYRSPEAFAAHRASDHFRRLVADTIIPDLDSRSVAAFAGDGALA